MLPRIFIFGFVRLSVGASVRPSVRRSVHPLVTYYLKTTKINVFQQLKTKEGHKKARVYKRVRCIPTSLQEGLSVSWSVGLSVNLSWNSMKIDLFQTIKARGSQSEHVINHTIMQPLHQSWGRIVGLMGLVNSYFVLYLHAHYIFIYSNFVLLPWGMK